MAVPKLRFKEFNGDWEKEYLGNIAIFFNNQRIPLSETERQKRQGKFRYYGASGVIDYVDDYLFDGEYILIGEDGANILTRSTPLAFIVKGQFWVNNHAHIFQSKDGNNTFLATYLENLNYKRFNSGTAQPKLNLDNLKKVPVANPTQEEQTKIAKFITAVDEKISQLNEQHQLMIQYKKGVMQKIFSQEIRFKDDNGEDFGEWKEKKLSEIAYITTGSSNREDSHEKNGMYTFFDRSEDIRTSNKYLFDSEALIIGGEGSIFKPKYFVGKFDLHQRAYAIMEFKNTVAKYLFYFIEFNHLYFLSVAVGTTVKSLRLPMFENMPVKLPSVDEQFKIADFLTAIDKRIENLARQLEQAKIWKKGLLQQMFV